MLRRRLAAAPSFQIQISFISRISHKSIVRLNGKKCLDVLYFDHRCLGKLDVEGSKKTVNNVYSSLSSLNSYARAFLQ